MSALAAVPSTRNGRPSKWNLSRASSNGTSTALANARITFSKRSFYTHIYIYTHTHTQPHIHINQYINTQLPQQCVAYTSNNIFLLEASFGAHFDVHASLAARSRVRNAFAATATHGCFCCLYVGFPSVFTHLQPNNIVLLRKQKIYSWITFDNNHRINHKTCF